MIFFLLFKAGNILHILDSALFAKMFQAIY